MIHRNVQQLGETKVPSKQVVANKLKVDYSILILTSIPVNIQRYQVSVCGIR